MASFFGEVRDLSSRAVDDDETEDYPVFTLTSEVTDDFEKFKSQCELVLFAVGDISTAFVKCYFCHDDTKLLMTVNYLCDRNDEESLLTCHIKNSIYSKQLKACSVYSINSNVAVCEILSNVPEEINVNLCSRVLKHLPCARAVVLTTCHMSAYKCVNPNDSETSFLRSLATSQYLMNNTCKIPTLSPPNFLANFPAAVLTEFEVTNKPAVAVICYVDSNSLDSVSVEVFERILDEDFVSGVSVNSDAKHRLANYTAVQQSCISNLYT
ncbi:proteasome assembly chaperone 1-like [Stegodyphus dumicola]|uniref:proteasome assembly chaperone 1-like n=1 Tax=Stegodyphus dumicola TaxID=202533 RepID=UPI0015AF5DD1|nr:proteasome assembly chaperone 1-like [Stegodyphus dumicola]